MPEFISTCNNAQYQNTTKNRNFLQTSMNMESKFTILKFIKIYHITKISIVTNQEAEPTTLK